MKDGKYSPHEEIRLMIGMMESWLRREREYKTKAISALRTGRMSALLERRLQERVFHSDESIAMIEEFFQNVEIINTHVKGLNVSSMMKSQVKLKMIRKLFDTLPKDGLPEVQAESKLPVSKE